MRAAVLVAALSSALGTLALADPAAAAIRTPTNIEPQALGSALRALAAERHLQILYTTDTVADRTTSGAVGELTVSEALDRLLGGTGLIFQYVDESTITVVPISAGRGASESMSRNSANAASANVKEAQKTVGFWDRFRVAQLDQESSRAGSVAAASVIEEIVVTAEKRAENLQNVAA